MGDIGIGEDHRWEGEPQQHPPKIGVGGEVLGQGNIMNVAQVDGRIDTVIADEAVEARAVVLVVELSQ